MSGMHLSKEFFELLKAIGESKSKQEEDRIIQREIVTLKKKLETKTKNTIVGGSQPTNTLNVNRKKAKEFLVRLLYVGELSLRNSALIASNTISFVQMGYIHC